MVAIVTGNGLGLLGSSLGQLGGSGSLGSSSQGTASDRVYVNAANGNLIVQRTDEFLRSLGPDAGILRTYNSQGLLNDDNGDNGDNWRLGLSRKITGLVSTVNTAGSSITRIDEDGAQSVYTYDTVSGKYISNAGAGAADTLTFNGSNWTWRDGSSQTSEQYDSHTGAGQLQSVTDRNGNTLTLTYTGGLITRLDTSSGERIDIVYDTASGKTANILEVRTQYKAYASAGTYQTLTHVRYSYDAANRLQSVSIDLTPNDNSVVDGNTYSTSYTYDGSSKRIASIVQSDGSEVRFTYDVSLRVATVQDVRSPTDIRTTVLNYSVVGQTTVIDALGQATTLVYDASGQLTGTTQADGSTVAYVYDAKGNVTQSTDARGNTVVYQYDSNNNRTYQRDAAGNVVEWEYSSNNDLLKETVYRVADPDGAGVQLPSQPIITRYTYDAQGHLRFGISAEGRVTEMRYDAYGQETSRIVYSAGLYTGSTSDLTALVAWVGVQNLSKTQRVDTAYDFRGQVQTVTSYANVGVDGIGIANGTQSQTYFVYDQNGQLLQTIDPRGVATTGVTNDYVTHYTYDGLGRVLTTVRTDANGTALTLSSNAYGDTTRLTTTTLANGLIRTTSYDQAGRVVSIVQTDSTLSAPQQVARTDYVYDKLGRPVAQRITTQAGSLLSTYVVYDSLGRKVADIYATGAMVEYVYNNNDQVIRTIGYGTLVTASKLTGDPTTFTLANLRPTGTTNRVTRQLYDTAGRLAKTIDVEGAVVEYQYDGASRLTRTVAYATRLTTAKLTALAALGNAEINPTDVNTTPVASSSTDRVTRQFYSDDGKTLGILDAEGYLTENIYDAAGQLTQTIRYATATTVALRTTATTVSALRPAVNAKDISTHVLYNARGQATGSIDAEGYLSEVQYDAAGNVTQSIRYATKVSVAITASQSVVDVRPAASASDRTTLNQYDSNNRITRQESQPDGLITVYAYDVAGNLLSVTHLPGTAQRQSLMRYDALGRVIAELSAENAARITSGLNQTQIDTIWNTYATRHTYDQASRRISSIDALGHKTLFYYDSQSQLTYTINAAGEVSRTVYNAFGNATENWHYKGVLSATQLASLSGGISTSALTTAVTAITATGIVKTRVDLTLRGQIKAAYDALNNDTQFTYNAFGELTQTSQLLSTGNPRLINAMTYDRRGLVTQTRQDTAAVNATTSKQYDAFGRVISSTATNGVVSTASYDKLGRTVRTDLGVSWNSFTYDAFGRTLTVSNSDGTTTKVYTDDQRKVTITSPQNITTSSITNSFGELISVTDGRGNITTYQYNKNGQLTSVTDPAGTKTSSYDAIGQVISSTDRNGIVTSVTYDAVGRTISRTFDPTGLNLTTHTRYDAIGRAVWVQDANGVWTRTDYDDKGQVTLVEIDPVKSGAWVSGPDDNPSGLALKTAYTYDAGGRTLTVTEGAGTAAARVTQYGYDVLGRRTSEVIDPTGLAITTSYSYDDADNLIKKVDANGNATHYGYDTQGRLTVTVDPTGAVTRSVYDAQNRVIATYRYAALINTTTLAATPANGVRAEAGLLALLPSNTTFTQTQYAYDKDGRQIYTVDALGVVRKNTYDANGNVTARTTYTNPIALSAGTSATTIAAAVVVHAQDQSTSYVFDTANRLIESRDGLNIATRYTYDANGNVNNKTIAFGTAEASTTAYVYDHAGRVIEQTVAAGTAIAATTRYQYDARGNRIAETDPRGIEVSSSDSAWALAQRKALGYTDANGVAKAVAALTLPEKAALLNLYTSRTVFDDAGRKIETSDALGNVTHYAYDERGNLTKLTDPRGNSAYFYYDADDRRTLYVDPEGYASKTEYGADGNVSKITQYANKATGTWNTSTAATVTPNATQDRVTQYQYDRVGRQTRITDAQGFEEVRSYDALGNLASLTNKVGGVTTYTYDARGLQLTETLPVTSANASGVQTPVVNQFIYDARGNRIQTIEALGLPEQRITTLAYNLKDQLVSKTGQAVSVLDGSFAAVTAVSIETYSYDARGNQTVVNNNGRRTVTYYDANNRKTAEVNAAGTLTTWTLDAAGNGIAKRVYGDALALPVDANTAPTPVNTSNVRTTNYAFNANNAVISSSQVADHTYAYGGGLVNGTVLTTRNTVDGNGNIVKTVDANGNATHYFYDTLGNKTLQVDAMGYGMAWTYNAAGEITRETRFASKLPTATLSALSTSSDATALQVQFAAGTQTADDRVTELVYDRMGRVLEQRVLNVATSSVNSTSGALTHGVIAAMTSYQYNGLGKVTQQTDAKLNVTNMGYDALGREIIRQLPQFNDAAATAVRETLSTVYDGLNQVKTVTQLGKTTADNRVQSFAYNANGGLTGRTDAMGYTTSYGLNIFGETVQTSLTRIKPDQTTTTDIKRYTYDTMGRQVLEVDQSTATTTNTRYDAYGAITGKGTNGVYAQVTEYNNLGQVWRTSNGDGVTKAFLYDANGNATMQIQSAGADLKNMTLAQMLASSDVHPTLTVYDKRNQVTDVIQPKMQFVHEDAGVQSVLMPAGNADPFMSGSLDITKGTVTATEYWELGGPVSAGELYLIYAYHDIYLPDLSPWGSGNIVVTFQEIAYSGYTSPEPTIYVYPTGQTHVGHGEIIGYQFGYDGYPDLNYASLQVKVYKRTEYGDINVATIIRQYAYGQSTLTSSVTQQLIFKGQPLAAETLKLKYRPVGSTGAYTEVMVPRFQINGNIVTGQFAMDWSSIPTGNYEYQYESFDGVGKVVNRVAGQMNINGASSSIVSQTAQQLDPLYVTQLKWVITGTQAAENQIHQTQEHNAFGEVVAEVDGLGRRTEFAYNSLGKLVLKRDPETDITLANGFISRARPEIRYYYDALGQVVGVQDANGNLNTMRYLDGLMSGAQIAQEYHADGGSKLYQYDVFGQLAAVTDELGQITRNTYDKNGNLILVDRVGSNDDHYEYDQAGNRIAHVNGLNNRETWTFDSLGRIVRASSLAGRVTFTSYAWDGTILALGSNVSTIGGWIKTVTDANGRTIQEKNDVFGRIRSGKDLGDHTTTYSYNAAGWLAQQTSTAGQNLTYDYYYNGYVKSITDTPNNSFTKYEYDSAGNRTFEGYTSVTGGTSREYYQYAEIGYDELNRVKSVWDPKYEITYEYDAVGNRRRVLSTYHNGVGGNLSTQDYWYKYDSMNRFTLTKGALADGRATSATGTSTIVKGTEGVEIGYDLASQRISAVYVDHAESYQYLYGLLTNTTIDGILRASRSNLDANGNLTNQVKYIEYNANGSQRTNTTYTYDADNNITTNHDNLTGQGTTYAYLADGTLNTTVTYGQATTVTTSYSYEWWGSAKEKEVRIQASNSGVQGWRPGFSRMTYDVNGNLKEAQDVEGGRSLRYVTNGEGLILSRNEIINNTIAKNHNWYYANGRQIGDVGNDGQSNEDYAQALAQDKGLSRKEINQRFKPVATADFDQNYQPINANYPALTASSYVVRSGDTLQSVAAANWGDSSLWYLIADANGLTSASVLTEGTSLVIPNKVANIHNSSSTFKVYNAGEKIGDTSPTLPEAPPPPTAKGGGCGMGSIIVIVIAIVATILTAGAALAALAPQAAAAAATAAGATAGTLGGTMAAGMAALGGGLGAAGFAAAVVGGVVGSVVSQGVAMAVGIQDKFSWKQVGISGLTAGITAGVGSQLPAAASFAGGGTPGVMMRTATANAIGQGISVATGIQKKFDWRGVAAAGIGSGIGSTLSNNNMFGAQGGRFAGAFVAGTLANGGKNPTVAFGSALGAVIGSSFEATFNPATDPENFARVQRFMTNSYADNKVQDASQAYTTTDTPVTYGFTSGPESRPETQLPKVIVTTTGSYVDPAEQVVTNALNAQAIYGGTTKAISSQAQQYQQPATSSALFTRGYNDPNGINRSVMDAPETATEFMGRVTGSTVNSFKDFGMNITGARSMNSATANFKAGNYGLALLHGANAFGEAGMTVFGFGITRPISSSVPLSNATKTISTSNLNATARSEAASHIRQARQILIDTRPDLNVVQRNEIIKAFDLPSFRIKTLTSTQTEYRYFDGIEAGLSGRWSTPQWFDTPLERINNLALPSNQATRAATVTLPAGTTVFQGTVAPQLRFGSNLTGGGIQSFNAAGQKAIFKEIP